MTERQIVSWRPAPPPPWRARLLVVLTALPSSVRRLGVAILVRSPPGSRLRSHVLGLGAHAGWQFITTVYTLAGTGVRRQVIMWDDGGDLAAELTAALDAAA